MRAILDLVAPPVCVGCGAHGAASLCPDCAASVRILADDAWVPGVERALGLVAFAEPARSLVLQLKRRGSAEVARGIGALLADLAHREHLQADVVTFVPAKRTAAVDHAELIARATAAHLDLPLRRLLRRAQRGPRQADVGLDARRENVRNRFTARRTAGRVLLIDDVLTTGATAEACARVLRGAGAEAVTVLTWARTLRRGPILRR